MRERKKPKRKTGTQDQHRKTCLACGCELGIPGGMGKTGLCGPCCTGESETLGEFGETW